MIDSNFLIKHTLTIWNSLLRRFLVWLRFKTSYWSDVNQTESESSQTDDKRDESFVPVTLFVTHDADDGADQAGGRAQAERDQHQEE